MSYCRWSSDDFRSDVYVYNSLDGVTIHVGAGRYAFQGPLPPALPVPEEITESWAALWVERQRAVSQLVDQATTEPIGLPHDGATLIAETPGEAAQLLRELVAEGYQVPGGVTEVLDHEQAELDAATGPVDSQPLPDAHGPTCDLEASCACSGSAR